MGIHSPGTQREKALYRTWVLGLAHDMNNRIPIFSILPYLPF